MTSPADAVMQRTTRVETRRLPSDAASSVTMPHQHSTTEPDDAYAQ